MEKQSLFQSLFLIQIEAPKAVLAESDMLSGDTTDNIITRTRSGRISQRPKYMDDYT
jgi:hypothetical protein